MRDKFKVRTLRGVASLLPLALLAPVVAASCGNGNGGANGNGNGPPDAPNGNGKGNGLAKH